MVVDVRVSCSGGGPRLQVNLSSLDNNPAQWFGMGIHQVRNEVERCVWSQKPTTTPHITEHNLLGSICSVTNKIVTNPHLRNHLAKPVSWLKRKGKPKNVLPPCLCTPSTCSLHFPWNSRQRRGDEIVLYKNLAQWAGIAYKEQAHGQCTCPALCLINIRFISLG